MTTSEILRAPERKRLAIFTGAGASAAFGLPVTSQITSKIINQAKADALFENDGASRNELREGMERLLPGLYRVEQMPMITAVLSMVDELIRSEAAPLPRLDTEKLVRLRTLLERAICEVIDVQITGDAMESRDAFKTWMAGKADSGIDVGLITTNYDSAVEQAFYHDSMDAIRSMPEFTNADGGDIARENHRAVARQFDFDFAWRAPYEVHSEIVFPRPNEPRFHWFKLHGSLNWLKCDLCQHIYVNPDFSITGVAFEEPNDSNSCHCGHSRLRPVIIAPSFVRDVRESNLLEVWRHSLEMLRRADEWIIIGYSLPDEDVGIRSLLCRAFNGRKKRPSVTLVTHGADSTRDARYLALFGDVTIMTGGLMDALPKL